MNHVQRLIIKCFGEHPVSSDGVLVVDAHDYNELAKAANRTVYNVYHHIGNRGYFVAAESVTHALAIIHYGYEDGEELATGDQLQLIEGVVADKEGIKYV